MFSRHTSDLLALYALESIRPKADPPLKTTLASRDTEMQKND